MPLLYFYIVTWVAGGVLLGAGLLLRPRRPRGSWLAGGLPLALVGAGLTGFVCTFATIEARYGLACSLAAFAALAGLGRLLGHEPRSLAELGVPAPAAPDGTPARLPESIEAGGSSELGEQPPERTGAENGD